MGAFASPSVVHILATNAAVKAIQLTWLRMEREKRIPIYTNELEVAVLTVAIPIIQTLWIYSADSFNKGQLRSLDRYSGWHQVCFTRH